MASRDLGQKELSAIFMRMGGLLLSEETLQSALDLICNLAHETLPGTSGAGVTLINEGEKRTAAHSDEIVRRADDLQYDLDEGPCLSAWKDNAVYRIDSLQNETRWPRWSPAGAALGMRSILSVPLVVRGDVHGAIKVYSDQTENYDDGSEKILTMFSQQAAFVLVNVQAYTQAQELGEHLKEALQNRDIIGEAKGILMEREDINDARAFEVLREMSQRKNEKLRDVARKIVGDRASRANPFEG